MIDSTRLFLLRPKKSRTTPIFVNVHTHHSLNLKLGLFLTDILSFQELKLHGTDLKNAHFMVVEE